MTSIRDFDENLNLNLNEYGYNELLALFSLEPGFDYNDLKRAKQVLVTVHPDKSDLPLEYFRFFLSAYKTILAIYKASSNKNDQAVSYDDLIQSQLNDGGGGDDGEKDNDAQMAEKMKHFNKVFDNLNKSAPDSGYGDWLTSAENCDEESGVPTNIDDMHMKINERKKQTSALSCQVEAIGINSGNTTGGFSDIYEQCNGVENYSSGIFPGSGGGGLVYNDLKQAHTESVVGVSDLDFDNKKKYANTNELLNDRSAQIVQTKNRDEHDQFLKDQHQQINETTQSNMFNLIQQEEEEQVRISKEWSIVKMLGWN
jgi:hypothetical protein